MRQRGGRTRWFAAALLGGFAGFAPGARAGVVYFEVAESPGRVVHNDSFVLPLIDPDQIAHARDLAARGPADAGASIVFAHITAGADGINRNLRDSAQPEWSWHVTSVDGFNDIGIELTDGWPTFVENDVPGWVENTGGQIGFWSYTVVRELPGYPATSPGPAVPLPAALPAAGAMMAGWVAARGLRRSARMPRM